MPEKLAKSKISNVLNKAAVLPKDKLKRKPDNRFMHIKKYAYSKVNNAKNNNDVPALTANEKIDKTVNEGTKKAVKVAAKVSAKVAKKLLMMAVRYFITVIIPLLFSTVGLIVLVVLLVIIIVYSAVNYFSFSGDIDDINKNPGVRVVEKYNNLNQDINSVVLKYDNKYHIKIDKYLILATLVGDKNPNFTADDSVKLKKDDFDDSKSYIKEIEELASYQIVKDKICQGQNRNDCPDAIYSYRTSIKRGNVYDKGSGSAFYWNLINGNFLNNYYSDLFKDKTNEEKIIKKVELVDFIYDYANGLKSLSENKLKE